jgi:flavorubredoxin
MARSTIDEVAPDIFRIANFAPDGRLLFAQFLIRDDQPLLFHTGAKSIYDSTLNAVSRLIDPKRLRYVSWSHLEGDECGALNNFLAEVPQLEPVQCAIGARFGADFFDRPVSVIDDDYVLDLGTRKLRFMATPHVPHSWDAICAYEETTGTLLVSDLFTVFGEQPAVTSHDIVEPSITALKSMPDYLPVGPHVNKTFARLEALQPRTLAGHHAPAFIGDATQALRDLRGELFRLHGMAG